jgi:uncharacterized protein (DUF1499 family)
VTNSAPPLTRDELWKAGRGRRWLYRIVLLAAVLLSPYLVTLRGQPAPDLGVTLAGLKECGDSPNCVGSDFEFVLLENKARRSKQVPPARPSHFVPPLELPGDNDADWKLLETLLGRQPGVTVIKSSDRYLRAERRSTIYGLIDDIELMRLFTGTVLIRSAARLGYSDFGRNRRFIERLRKEFEARGQAH